MSKRVLVVAFATLLVAASAGVAAAQSGNSVRGKLITDQGKPVIQAIVMLEAAGGQLVGQTTTNNEGDFSFSGLGGGTYFVVVREIDYQQVRERVEFTVQPGEDQPGESQFISVALAPKSTVTNVGAAGTVFVQEVPPPAKAAYDRGVALAREGKSTETIAAYREAIVAFPDYFDAHFALAGELMKANTADEAMTELDRARQINPKDARVYATFGLLLIKQRKLSVAAAAFGEAARLAPSEPQYRLLRATVLIDQASSIDAAKPEAAKARTDLLTAASQDLDSAFDLSGKKLATVHLQRARLFERQNDRKRAADELEAYLKQVPNAPNATAIRDSVTKLRSAH